MKKILYILLLLLFSWPAGSSAHTQVKNHIPQSGVIKTGKGSKEKIPFISITGKSDRSEKFNIPKHKKKGKGLQTLPYFLSDQRPLLFVVEPEELFYVSHTLFSDRICNSNQKRGPPAALLS